jgi:hypothetical protein
MQVYSTQKRIIYGLSVVVHIHNPATQEVEIGGFQFQTSFETI